VYAVLADYLLGHPSILPPKYFRHLRVVDGGQGAGTRITFEIVFFGAARRFEARVSEPEPGRRLVETDVRSGIATTFTVDADAAGRGSSVTIATRYRKPGLAGYVERWLSPRFLRAVYRDELRLLADKFGAR
jgi:hypothetical protein